MTQHTLTMAIVARHAPTNPEFNALFIAVKADMAAADIPSVLAVKAIEDYFVAKRCPAVLKIREGHRSRRVRQIADAVATAIAMDICPLLATSRLLAAMMNSDARA
jgi:hypothetical protein